MKLSPSNLIANLASSGAREGAGHAPDASAAFGAALGKALGEGPAPAQDKPRRRDGTPRRGDAEGHHQTLEHAPLPSADVLQAAGHPRAPAQASEQPSDGQTRALATPPGGVSARMPLSAPSDGVRARPRSTEKPAGRAAETARVRPGGAQLAARLGLKPVPKGSPGAPPTTSPRGRHPGQLRQTEQAGQPDQARESGHERSPERERPREATRTVESSGPLTARAETPSLVMAAEARPLRAASPQPAAARAPAPLPPPPTGYDVSGAVLRSAAHLKIDAGALGALELHLRVRDGALHLRVGGDAAHLVEARAGELSHALAGEGLKLAPVESARGDGTALQSGGGGGQQGGEQRRDAWSEALDARDDPRAQTAARSTAGAAAAVPPASTGNRIDVKA